MRRFLGPLILYSAVPAYAPAPIYGAAGMRGHQNRIEGACYGDKKISNDRKDQVKSLLIETVQHRPEDQPLTVEWLRDWYGSMIEDEPEKRYKWMAPGRYESPEAC